MTGERIDLGLDHSLVFYAWAPDDLPENRALYNVPDGAPMPKIDKAGAIVRHRGAPPEVPAADQTGWCEGGITFDLPDSPLSGPRWTVVTWEPLTLTPSILCSCGDHGFITNGQWVPA